MTDRSGLTIAIGGSAWTNRPVSYLAERACDELRVARVLSRDIDDLPAWLPRSWGEPELLRVDLAQRPLDPQASRLAAAALGLVCEGAPLRPDLTILHVPYADENGVAHLFGDADFERMVAAASERVVVIADEIVSVEQSAGLPSSHRLASDEIDEMHHRPYGAFPGACDGLYRSDSSLQGACARWLDDRERDGTPDDGSFLELFADAYLLAALSMPHGLDWPTR